jgi:hypothetical protein
MSDILNWFKQLPTPTQIFIVFAIIIIAILAVYEPRLGAFINLIIGLFATGKVFSSNSTQ